MCTSTLCREVSEVIQRGVIMRKVGEIEGDREETGSLSNRRDCTPVDSAMVTCRMSIAEVCFAVQLMVLLVISVAMYFNPNSLTLYVFWCVSYTACGCTAVYMVASDHLRQWQSRSARRTEDSQSSSDSGIDGC